MSYWYLYGMYGYNGLFILIFIAVMIFAVYAQIKVKRTFKKYKVTEVNSDQADALSNMYGLHFVSLNDLKKSLLKII